jgi:photosystem I subunit IX
LSIVDQIFVKNSLSYNLSIVLILINFFVEKGKNLMKDFTTYLSTAPVAAILSLTVVAGFLIEINRFFPDALIFAF